MSVYLAQHSVRAWSDDRTWKEARQLYRQHAVRNLHTDGSKVSATVDVLGRSVRTRFTVQKDGSVLSDCPCPLNQNANMICVHVVAAGIALADLTEDTQRERSARIAKRQKREQQNSPPASPLSGRTIAPDDKSANARIMLRLPENWAERLQHRKPVAMNCFIVIDEKRHAPEKLKPGRLLAFSHKDFELLYILEDMAGTDCCPSQINLTPQQFSDCLDAAQGFRVINQNQSIQVLKDPALSALSLHHAPDDPRSLELTHTSLPEGKVILVARQRTWLYSDNNLMPLEPHLPRRWQSVYRRPIHISPGAVVPFLNNHLPELQTITIVENESRWQDAPVPSPGTPTPAIATHGSITELSLTPLAVYEGISFAIMENPTPDHAVPSSQNPDVFVARNPEAERALIETFNARIGSIPDDKTAYTISGSTAVMKTLNQTLESLSHEGWEIRHTPDSFAHDCKKGLWIEPRISIKRNDPERYRLELEFVDATGAPVPTELVENAIKDEQPLMIHDGKSLMLDLASLQNLQAALAECLEYEDGNGYIKALHAGFLHVLQQQHHRLTIAAPPEWEAHARTMIHRSALPAVELPPHLKTRLRGYQQEGVNWLRFLDQYQYSGILADEMGLGKTVQALAWLLARKQTRTQPAAPAIVVCPTSLIHNWAREVDRFTPELGCCVMAGANRSQLRDQLLDHDIIITSYALLRRDIKHYDSIQFSAAILDEAQHIKNRSTQNAVAAKRIKADARLVLTGTPIENSVADLWSIMDYLMPGYLGSHNSFRIRFEQPIATDSNNAGLALQRLRNKLDPFLLRRVKQTVAAELPDKVSRIASCTMHPAQQKLYRRLQGEYFEQLSSLVDNQGFEKSRFSVFSALLRLRQCCCHPALLQSPESAQETPSGKMDLFFELLDEAMDGGHRVLVFSQFVKMLHILRHALNKRGIPFAYLDGSTRNRMEEVDRFNNSKNIPVFLVSLKAGGSGLNLTGANVVIHYDPWWNPAVEDQATDRAHRIGQTRTVYSIKLVTEDSIEQKVIELQHRKRNIINAAMGASSGIEQLLTWEDVRDLLQLHPSS